MLNPIEVKKRLLEAHADPEKFAEEIAHTLHELQVDHFATKTDLKYLEDSILAKIEATEQRLRGNMNKLLFRYSVAIVTILGVLMGLLRYF